MPQFVWHQSAMLKMQHAPTNKGRQQCCTSLSKTIETVKSLSRDVVDVIQPSFIRRCILQGDLLIARLRSVEAQEHGNLDLFEEVLVHAQFQILVEQLIASSLLVMVNEVLLDHAWDVVRQG